MVVRFILHILQSNNTDNMFNMEEFTEDSLSVIGEALNMAKEFNSADVNEYHFVSKLWIKLEYPIRNMDCMTNAEFDALSNYWFDHLKVNAVDIKKSSLTSATRNILGESKKICRMLEMTKVNPLHLLFAILTVDSKVSIMLKQYGMKPLDVLKMDYTDVDIDEMD